ncbi:hypothetical protein E2C01_008353 [Portunus trituberculatus]|uniref:Uncharacterized protein n=1 Tax=Portunus trituberculatus TaxID=210409 RepID=A0A5B7D0K8_PORTR|nr:hypothetical protein [Portunus trituberculatus]
MTKSYHIQDWWYQGGGGSQAERNPETLRRNQHYNDALELPVAPQSSLISLNFRVVKVADMFLLSVLARSPLSSSLATGAENSPMCRLVGPRNGFLPTLASRLTICRQRCGSLLTVWSRRM